MALRFPTQFPLSSSSFTTSPKQLSFQQVKPHLTFTQSTFRTTKPRLAIKAAAADDDSLKPTNGNVSESQTDNNQQNTQQTGEDPSKLGEEIRKAMNERDIAAAAATGGGAGDLWGGVAEEIKKIEWPAFGKVLGTTGAVIGVIAGSSLVLLTLNAILAELSDRVFTGKGVQDFFS
ncbi:preprotein translocase subunit SECE1 [Impatiens glandulifera]|uniref:preprotein translocase subunit SECE1 n=1 Tax=Impatiens glandulifera TaxID=253017 RepID=UPI001FB104D6|nr:preprotein translocase subunit SECE1 [Impatiens glandulifera]